MSRRYKNEVNLKKKQLIVKIILALICIIGLFVIRQSYAKYVIQASDIHTQQATSFYLESDFAEAEEKTYNITYWDGTSYDISFFVRNYTDDLQASSEEITYTITTNVDVTGTGTVEASVVHTGDGSATNKSEAVTTTEGNETGLTLAGDGSTYSKSNYKLTVSQSNLSDGDIVTVTITIKSSSPYIKTMTAIVNLNLGSEEAYETSLTDNEDYVTLTLKINDTSLISSNITIEYDTSTLTLDTASTVLNSAKELSSSNLTEGKIILPVSILETGQIVKIYFVKVDTSDTIELNQDITVT